ncbi:hypothetical protein [Amycolatopsis samaneae]|uniref:Uncharacterized protein n=1 Tax=Amycolatopsis samaneae TaxID=664691 RepID=A0ABW5G9T1_9PSEU
MSAKDVVEELKLVRKGRGVFADDLGDRVGPALRALCGIADGEDVAEIRRKLSTWLRGPIAQLPTDLRITLLAAYGLHSQAQRQFLRDRVLWVAEELERDERTINRRIKEGTQRVAELAVQSEPAVEPPSPGRGWHTEWLGTTLALDQPVPEVVETRRIVADVDGVSDIDLAFTLTTPDPRGPAVEEPDLRAHVFRGARLVRREMESSDRAKLSLRLPAPLRRGDRHEITLRFLAVFRFPHYVCVPRHPIESFELHVRFARPMPEEIVRLDRVFQNDALNRSVRGTALEPDDAGEVHLRFRQLTPGFAYGVRWNVPEAV